MNEVEKMYENANLTNFYCDDDYVAERMSAQFECTSGDKEKCKTCDKAKTKYPPFTAEKQIELIKWMIKTNHRYFIQDIIADDFSETLAGVFNFYWQYLTEEERKQVKGILV